MAPEEERVWAYLVDHRKADATEVALNCDVSEIFAQSVMSRIASPNWREERPLPMATEGLKFDQGKARYDLVPPEIEEAIAQVLTFGANKYGDRNWEKGMNWGRAYAALRRHMNAWWSGEDNDPETGMPHTWHAACCIAFLVSFQARGVGKDDRHKLEVVKNARMAAKEGTRPQVA